MPAAEAAADQRRRSREFYDAHVKKARAKKPIIGGCCVLSPHYVRLREERRLLGELFVMEGQRVRAVCGAHIGRVGSIIELLRRNDDRDVFLRHAAVQALEGMEDPEAILQFANNASPAVRRAVLLVLRRHQDARVARFLFDPETFSTNKNYRVHERIEVVP